MMESQVAMAAVGLAMGLVSLVFSMRVRRSGRASANNLREELLVMMAHQRTEWADGLSRVQGDVATIQEVAAQAAEAGEDRVSPSIRTRAIQMLRRGEEEGAVAVSLGLPRSDVRLIGEVFRGLGA